jgi:hypothetical protein
MKIKPSYFDYGGEVDVCYTYRIKDKPARLCIRRIKGQYELYAHTLSPDPFSESILLRGSLEEVVQITNSLMTGNFGPSWEPDVIEPNGSP